MTDTSILSRITPRTLLVAAIVACAVLAAGLATTLLLPPGTTPVGLTLADGNSMGQSGQQVVLYADLQPGVGDVVIFDAGPEHGLVRHRIVDATAQGFVTRGDANAMVDQQALSSSLDGMSYATSDRVRGVSLMAVPVSLLEGVGSGLLGVVFVVGLWRFRREIAPALGAFSRRVASGKALPTGMALLVVLSVLSGIPFGGSLSPTQNASAAETVLDDFESGSLDSDWIGQDGASATTASAFEGDYGFEGTETNGNLYAWEDGTARTPDTISFWMNGAGDGGGDDETFTLKDGTTTFGGAGINNTGYLYVLDPAGGRINSDVSVTRSEWLMFRFTNIDYSNEQYDIQVYDPDGNLLYENTGVGFANSVSQWTRMSVTVAGVTYADNLKLGADPPSSGYAVSGTVTHDGDPLENVSVSDGNGNSTTTNATGQYSLSLANGTYDLTASKGTFVDDTETVTVDGAPLTNVNFTLGTPITGTVRDQNDQPVADATVRLVALNYSALNWNGLTAEELQDRRDALLANISNPTPPAWKEQNGSDFKIKGYRGSDKSSFVERADTADAMYPLAHTAEDWDVGGLGLPHTGTSVAPNPDLTTPAPVYTPEDYIVLSTWDPTKSRLINDGVTSDNPGAPTDQPVVLQRLDAGDSAISNRTITPQPFVKLTNIQNLGTDTHYAAPVGQLDAGFYKIYPQGSPERAYLFAVAPGGDVSNIGQGTVQALKTEAGELAERSQNLEDREQANEIEVLETTTDSDGKFNFTFDSKTLETVEITAYKAPSAMNVDPQNPPTQGEIASFFDGEVADYRDRIKQEYDLTDLDPQQADQEIQQLCGRATSDLGNVVNDVGGGYAPSPSKGSVVVSPPKQDVTVRVVGAEVPEYADSANRLCYDTAFEELVKQNDFANLSRWAQGNLSDLNDTELQQLYADTMKLAEGNEEVCRGFMDSWGVDPQGECDGGMSDDDGDGVVGDSDPGGGTAPVPAPDTYDPGDGDTPPLPDGTDVSDLRRQVNNLQQTIDGLRDQIDSQREETKVEDGTVSTAWSFDTDLSESEVVVKGIWANGTQVTLTPDSKYVEVDTSIVGDDVVRLVEYPIGANDPASIRWVVHVSGPDGLGRDDGLIKNPAFSGSIPQLESVRLSTTSPGPDDTVRVGVVPAERASFGSLSNVTVKQGGQTVATPAVSNGDAAFATNGTGIYRVRLEYTNADGDPFVQWVSVEARGVSHQLPPTVAAESGPTGVFAIASNGLESGVIEVQRAGADVDVQAVIAADGDTPGRIAVHTRSLDLATESTTTVRLVRAPDRQNVRRATGVILHTVPLGDEPTIWRKADGDSQALPRGGENEHAIVALNDSQATIEFVTEGDGAAAIKTDRDPGFGENLWYEFQTGELFSLAVFVTPSGVTPTGGAVGGAGITLLVTPLGIGLLRRRWQR